MLVCNKQYLWYEYYSMYFSVLYGTLHHYLYLMHRTFPTCCFLEKQARWPLGGRNPRYPAARTDTIRSWTRAPDGEETGDAFVLRFVIAYKQQRAAVLGLLCRAGTWHDHVHPRECGPASSDKYKDMLLLYVLYCAQYMDFGWSWMGFYSVPID